MSEDVIAHNRRVYNRIAKHFSATRSWIWDDLAPLKQYVKKSDRVLDLACGNGRLYLLLLDLSISYLGVDYSEELLKQAREKFPSLEFKYGEMTNIPAPDNQFDVVFCLAAFHHLPDTETRSQALKEMRRVLKPGGRIIMTNWNLYSEWAKEKLRNKEMKKLRGNCFVVPWKNQAGEVVGERIYYAYSQTELNELFESAGLTVEAQYIAVKKGAKNAGEGQNIVTVAKNTENKKTRKQKLSWPGDKAYNRAGEDKAARRGFF